MSRPGYWKSGGTMIAMTAMTESHLKNSLRLMARRIAEYTPTPTDSPTVAGDKRIRAQYYETKLCELGAEAQRRNVLPAGDITVPQLCAIVSVWPSSIDSGSTLVTVTSSASRAAPRPAIAPGTLVTAGRTAYTPSTTVVEAMAAAPPRVLGRFTNVIKEVQDIIGLPVAGEEDNGTKQRNIQFEL